MHAVPGAGDRDVEDIGALQKTARGAWAVRIEDEREEHGVAFGSLEGMRGAGDELVVAQKPLLFRGGKVVWILA